MQFENLDNQTRTNNEVTDGQNALQQAALRLYQCGPGGPIVTKPSDCLPMNGNAPLPNLEIVDSSRGALT